MNHQELQALTFTTFTCFVGIRAHDVDLAKTKNWSKQPADKNHPRRHQLIVDKTKNDPAGTGPVAGRTFVLPCICLEVLASEDVEKRKFVANLKKDPNCTCPCPCPYGILSTFFAACPNKTGEESFMRTLSGRGGKDCKCSAFCSRPTSIVQSNTGRGGNSVHTALTINNNKLKREPTEQFWAIRCYYYFYYYNSEETKSVQNHPHSLQQCSPLNCHVLHYFCYNLSFRTTMLYQYLKLSIYLSIYLFSLTAVTIS